MRRYLTHLVQYSINPFFLRQSREHGPSLPGDVVDNWKRSGAKVLPPQALKRLPSEFTKENVQKPRQRVPRHASLTGRSTLYSYKSIDPAPTVIYINDEEEADDLVRTLEG